MAVVNTNLELKFDICQSDNCRWLIFDEETGTYHAVTNPGGWGAPNPEFLDVSSASLDIITPDGVRKTFFDTPPFFWDEGGNFPTDDNSLKYIITAEMLGQTNKITDGFYKFIYNVNGVFGVNTYVTSAQCEKLITCQAQCGISKLAKEAAKSDCSTCKDDKKKMVLKLKAKLLSAEGAAACGMKNRAIKILNEVNWLLNQFDCSC